MSERPSKRQIPGRTVLPEASDQAGREVLLLEALAVSPGDAVIFRFDRVNSQRRQGIWLGTTGILKIESTSPQFHLWADTAPPEVRVEVLETDGSLRFYNCFMKPPDPSNLAHMNGSGMITDETSDGWTTYSCNDVGVPPVYDKLVFSVKVERRG
jgi:hypothetical protein